MEGPGVDDGSLLSAPPPPPSAHPCPAFFLRSLALAASRRSDRRWLSEARMLIPLASFLCPLTKGYHSCQVALSMELSLHVLVASPSRGPTDASHSVLNISFLELPPQLCT